MPAIQFIQIMTGAIALSVMTDARTYEE